MVDADAILQVLGNFLSNARKYSPEGGSVRMGARVVGKMVEVYIRDHGLGIPTEDLPNLFHRFYRVDSADSPKGSLFFRGAKSSLMARNCLDDERSARQLCEVKQPRVP